MISQETCRESSLGPNTDTSLLRGVSPGNGALTATSTSRQVGRLCGLGPAKTPLHVSWASRSDQLCLTAVAALAQGMGSQTRGHVDRPRCPHGAIPARRGRAGGITGASTGSCSPGREFSLHRKNISRNSRESNPRPASTRTRSQPLDQGPKTPSRSCGTESYAAAKSTKSR